MANFGKKYDLKTEDDETYCSYMVLLEKLIYKLGEMDDQRKGSWKRIKRLWLANEHTTELIELKEELDATELETAALKRLENNVILKKLLEIVEALNVASPKKSSVVDLRKKQSEIYETYKLDLFMVQGEKGNMDLANDFIHLQVVEKEDQVQHGGDNAGSEKLDVHNLFEHVCGRCSRLWKVYFVQINMPSMGKTSRGIVSKL